jgi:hypothetical protein
LLLGYGHLEPPEIRQGITMLSRLSVFRDGSRFE